MNDISDERLAELIEFTMGRDTKRLLIECRERREAMRGVDQGTHVVVPQKLMRKIDVYLSIINPWDESAQTKLRGEVKSAMLAAAQHQGDK